MSQKMPKIDGLTINELIAWLEGEKPPLIGEEHHATYYDDLRARALPELRKIAARASEELPTEVRWDHALSRVAYRLINGESKDARAACAEVADEIGKAATTVEARWYGPDNEGLRTLASLGRPGDRL